MSVGKRRIQPARSRVASQRLREATMVLPTEQPKRGRGRPRKNPLPAPTTPLNAEDGRMQRTMDAILEKLEGLQETNGHLREANCQLQETNARLQEVNAKSHEVNLQLQEVNAKCQDSIAKLLDEVKTLQETVGRMESSFAPPTSRPSYATIAANGTMAAPDAAATPPTSRPSVNSLSDPAGGSRPTSSAREQARAKHGLAGVTLNLKGTALTSAAADELETTMNHALQNTEATEGLRCEAVRAGNPERTSFFFANEDTAQTVRRATPWTNCQEKGFDQATLGASRAFKAKAFGVDARLFQGDRIGEAADGQVVKEAAHDAEVAILEIRRISPPTRNGLVQAVVLCPTKDDQERLLRRAYLKVRGALVEVGVFHEWPVLRQCFRCWKFGHNASACQAEEICVRCAATDHRADDCMAEQPKCNNCGGPHAVNDRSCRARRLGHQSPTDTHARN